MRIVNRLTGDAPIVPQGAIVFDDHRDLRGYVRGVVIGLAEGLQGRLPAPVRWIVSADKLGDLLGAAFDRLWPVGMQASALPQVP